MDPSMKKVMPVIISACVLLILSFGFRSGFGLFMQPMSEANEWGRDVLSMALAVQNLFWGLVAFLAGGLADRYGNLRVLLTAVVLYALGIWTMSYATNQWEAVASAGVLVGAGIAGTSFGIVLPVLARAVPEEKRGWALGVGTAAGSIGQFLVVPLMQELIEGLGWFDALQIMSLLALLMAGLIMPLVPYSGAQQNETEINASLRQIFSRAVTVPSYQLLTIGFFVCGFHVAFITVHMPAYVVDLGFDARVGAWSLSLIGLFNVFGAFYSGILSGKKPKRKLLSMIYIGRVVAIVVFLLTPVSMASILVFSVVLGVLWLATVPPTTGLVAVFFGTRYMAFLYGFVFLSHQLGSFCGVLLGGYLYEQTGSYTGVWIAGAVLSLIAAMLHWPIRESDYRARLAEG